MLKLLSTSRRYLYAMLTPVAALLAVLVLLGSTSAVALARPIPPREGGPACKQIQTYPIYSDTGSISPHPYKVKLTVYGVYDYNTKQYCGKMFTQAQVTRFGYDADGGYFGVGGNYDDRDSYPVQSPDINVPAGGNITVAAPQIVFYADCAIFVDAQFKDDAQMLGIDARVDKVCAKPAMPTNSNDPINQQ